LCPEINFYDLLGAFTKPKLFMKLYRLTIILLPVLLYSFSVKGIDYTKQVNPFIGTGGHGHTYPGASLPHGMVQLSPDTRTNGWDACSGYHYNDSTLLGFSHTHLSGTGIGDLGDVLFLPFTNDLQRVAPNGEDKLPEYGSLFSHKKENATPGYYSVHLDSYDIDVELTTTLRTGFHRYSFPKDKKAGLLIDLTRTIHDRQLQASEIKIISDTEIIGMKQVKGWAPNRYLYFCAVFSEPFIAKVDDNKKAILTFKNPTEQVLVKVALSMVDYEGAKNNLLTENNDWNFDAVRENAQKIWNHELSKITIRTKDESEQKIFYSALYHTALQPIIISDADGRYRTIDNKIVQDKNYCNYSIFSLWDTFRALHPLNTIISPKENQAMIRSLIRKYDEGGILPMWELHSNETGCMIGYHSVSVIVDSYMKGERDFNIEKAYQACKKSSAYDTTNISSSIERGILYNNLMPVGKSYKNTIGYIPAEIELQSVARGLEYAYNDWLIAQFAKELGHADDYSNYFKLSKNYKNYYDPSTGFMRGKQLDGTWRIPFDPKFSNHNHDDYCEGNAWQWLWFVIHDVDGLVDIMGGKEKFTTKLDSLFSVSSEMHGSNVSADISGLIGQYAHGNEPSHQTIHLYNQVNKPYKTEELIDQVLRTLYFNDPNGLSGNEDCGEMSAWYVLNSMGFYSYCPGKPFYSIGRPLFDKVDIHLENGNTFTIKTINNSPENKFIQSVEVNGKRLNEMFFSHEDLMKGGEMVIRMKNTH
jgi:predicted alpha-1,2-mannosidase